MIDTPRSRSGKTAINDLSASVKRYATKPYRKNGQIAWDYHIAAYDRWCRERELDPFPLDVYRILEFAADRAQRYAFFNVRESVRLVAMQHRKMTGEDLYSNTRVATFLAGLRRTKPPRPLLPLQMSKYALIVDCVGKTWKTRRSRVMAMLIWNAGFTLRELHLLDVEMVSFNDKGANVRFPSSAAYRERVFIGRAQESKSCPVLALEQLISERGLKSGAIFNKTAKGNPGVAYRLAVGAVGEAVKLLGKQVGIVPLTIERIRLGGIIAQSRNVDIVTLASYHGLRAIEHLANFVEMRTERSGRHVWKRYSSYSGRGR